MDINELVTIAKKAAKNAYAPYSGYKVGAVAVCGDKLYTGCNVENASYGLTMCAERVAIYKAVTDGCRKIDMVVVYAANSIPYPCGACLQVMAEFCDDTCQIILADENKIEKYSFAELLPRRFSKDALQFSSKHI